MSSPHTNQSRIATLRTRTDRLIAAGNELADMLRRSPGIDPMRDGRIGEWRDAAKAAAINQVEPRIVAARRSHQDQSKRRWRVYCTQFAQCRWAGYRWAETRDQAVAKPCPRCERAASA